MKKSILSCLVLAMVCTNFAYATGPEWVGAYSSISASLIIAEELSVNEAAYAISGATTPIVMSTIIGSAAGFGTAMLMNEYIFSDCQNSKACDVAKIGTYAGAAIGTTCTVIMMDSVSAVGLATISTVGLTVWLVVTPIVAAIAAGGATYWLFSGDDDN
ncbi:MAG: hypothetical protein KAI83_18910 [Thiomargarita sp.]|nr:hypothetical protein [Thiomargarita sp.]